MVAETSRPRWRGVVLIAVVVASIAAAAGLLLARNGSGPSPSGKPNLVFILSDDQRWDTMQLMPVTRRIFNLDFPQAVVTTPLCCPSRSSYLTGRFAHNTGVVTNSDYPTFKAQEPDSLGPWLRSLGYYTGFVGKYFNRYSVDDPVPPGWDEFYARVWGPEGQHIGNGFTELSLRERWTEGHRVRGGIVPYPNPQQPDVYSTRLFADLAVRFLQRADDRRFNPEGKPWALLVWTVAPNGKIAEDRYAHATIPPWSRPPSFLEPDMSDKPSEVQHGPDRVEDPAFHERERAGQLRTLPSVDDLVSRVFAGIDAAGSRSRTWGIYASDNGRLWGEHHLSRKLYGYEESVRVPLRVAAPGFGPATFPQVVANIDVTPTLLELAGDRKDRSLDGRSIVPLVTGKTARWRWAVLIENRAYVRYQGLRTEGWKYIRWMGSGNEELYDLRHDPFELRNVIDRAPAGVLGRLRAETDRLSRQ